MGFDFASAKKKARQAVHDTLGVSALYQDNSMVTPVEIKARWHNKLTLEGNLDDDSSYAQMLEGIDRIILNKPQLATLGIQTRRGAVLTFTSLDNLAFKLDTKEPSNGPIEEIWKVTRS